MLRAVGAMVATVLLVGCNDIGSMRRRRDVAGLMTLLSHSDAEIRIKAVDALGYVGDSRAVEPLIKALGDSDHYVREHAARNLGCDYHSSLGCDSSKTIPPLIAILEDDDAFVRVEAARSLGENPQPSSREPLEGLARNDERWEVRHAAVEALGRVSREESIPVLESLLDDEEELVRVATRRALRRLAAVRRANADGREQEGEAEDVEAVALPEDEHIDDDDARPADGGVAEVSADSAPAEEPASADGGADGEG